MDGEAADVAHVREMAVQLERVDERLPGGETALDAEREDRAASVRQVLLGALVPRARREPWVLHPLHLVARFEPLRDRHRVLRVTFHAEAQRLERLQEEERVER